MHGKLSDNKKVTAIALSIYDPDLPGPLAAELQNVGTAMKDEEKGELRAFFAFAPLYRRDVVICVPGFGPSHLLNRWHLFPESRAFEIVALISAYDAPHVSNQTVTDACDLSNFASCSANRERPAAMLLRTYPLASFRVLLHRFY